MPHRSHFLLVQALALLALFCLPGLAQAESPYGVSGPFVHKNLAVYMILGPSRPGPVPLTLQEALAQGTVKLHETGYIARLKIENQGDRPVFLQAGDLVKGGKQDRVLSVSLLLPPKSGAMAVHSFCVERGRWGARGKEDASRFTSGGFALPSRKAKLAIALPLLSSTSLLGSSSQRDLWKAVELMQRDLSTSLSTRVASMRSPSSLQLSLESDALNSSLAPYVEALKEAGTNDRRVVGFAFAINGALNSAEVFPSHGLFKKLWPKLLKASATEAIAASNGNGEAKPPSGDAVLALLKQAEDGKKTVKTLARQQQLASREGERMVFLQTSHVSGPWMHRSYIVK